jgi:hypothetical protein
MKFHLVDIGHPLFNDLLLKILFVIVIVNFQIFADISHMFLLLLKDLLDDHFVEVPGIEIHIECVNFVLVSDRVNAIFDEGLFNRGQAQIQLE